MKALVWNYNEIQLIEKNCPTIVNPNDAIVKVTLSSICTSDLHIIKGFVPKAKPNTVLGHEFVGEIVELGENVKNFKIGDRVSINCETFCGNCFFCQKGFINNCENGGWEIGCTIDGCHAEYVRVPYASMGMSLIPPNVSDENALFVGDILSSGYFGIELCELKQNETIAIIGAGPVGLCAMTCAKLFNPSKIIAIDIDSRRLEIARKLNLADIVLNPNECNIEAEIKNHTNNRGADCIVEAAGGKNTFEMAWKIARANANIALVGMYEQNQILPLPQMYGKNLTFKTGGVDAIHCKQLLELISNGKINTDFLITHHFSINDIVKAYSFFENKKNNCLKIAIHY